jgi:hypothetical protein
MGHLHHEPLSGPFRNAAPLERKVPYSNDCDPLIGRSSPRAQFQDKGKGKGVRSSKIGPTNLSSCTEIAFASTGTSE